MRSYRTAVVGLLAIAGATGADAQGFGVYEQGTCAMAQAGAGVAAPCGDGSAIYFNPAALDARQGPLVSAGITAISGTSRFTSDAGRSTDSTTGVEAPPHVYFQYDATDNLVLGLGAYTPYGLRVSWPSDFEGRFVAYDAALTTIYIQPTAAYRFTPTLSVGGGLVIAASRLSLDRREDLAATPLPGVPGLTFESLVDVGTDLADTSLSSSWTSGIGGNLGVLVTPHPQVRVGARFLTSTTLDYEGTVTFDAVDADYRVTKPNPLLPVGTPLDPLVAQILTALPDQGVETSLEMPAQFELGMSVDVTPRLTVSGDYHWVDWSAFETVGLIFERVVPPDEYLVQHYNDTSALRVGTEFALRSTLRLRGGYAFNQAAAPDETVTPLLPDAKRHHLTAGIGVDVGTRWTVDAAYQFIDYADRRGRTVSPPRGELPTVALNSGVYATTANLFGITLTFHP